MKMASSSGNSKYGLQRAISFVALLYIVVIIAFAWGYLSFKNKSFPHQLIQDMRGTITSLRAQKELREDPRSAHEIATSRQNGGVTINELPDGGDDLIFVTWFRGESFVVDLIDRNGDVVHNWRMPYDQVDMSQARDRDVKLFLRNQTIHGAHLDSDGNVLFVNEYHGMVKLSADSKLLWKTEHANHHAVTVGLDGSVWSLNRRTMKDKNDWVPLATAPYVDDTVVQYSPGGALLDEFSITQLIVDNRFEGILYGGPPWGPRLPDRDPLHVNDIDVLTADQAAFFPNTRAGDIMLSLRTPNNIIIVRPEGREIRWSMTGPFLRQHDPQITRDGLLLVYDNRTVRAQLGGKVRYLDKGQQLGYSRVIALDPLTREVRWEYAGSEKEPFFSSIQGKHEELKNGDVLVVEPEGGRIFQVDRATGEIVWEHVNLLEPGIVGRVTQAVPFDRSDLAFLSQAQTGSEQKTAAQTGGPEQ
jgi:hypothetical protein